MLMLCAGKISIGNGADARLSHDPGISSEYCETGREALACMGQYDYDVLLIDLDLPDMAGHETIRLARAAGHSTPCIVLASAVVRQIKVKALDQGADDFIIVPCDPAELRARVRAVLRRSNFQVRPGLRFGPVEINPDRHEVRVSGALLAVSRREFALLELLFQKPGVAVSKDALLKGLYNGTNEPDMKAIDVIVCRLRQKLVAAGVFGLIDTAWGCGYVLREPRLCLEPTNVAPLPASPFLIST
jgi:two-component system cell cycle response regulator CtrA